MEERVDGDTPRPDVDRDSRSSAVVRRGDPEPEARTTTAGAPRRYSLADFRRRDTAANHHAAPGSTQFKGLVIPSSPAGGGGGKPSTCFLPTIAGTKPQSQLPLTSSMQDGRGGYRSPFVSTSSNAPRHSSVYGYPLPLPHPSTSSVSTVKPSGTAQCVTDNSVCDDGDVGGANDPDLPQHADELSDRKSRRPLVSADCAAASDDVPTQVSGIPPDNGDEGTAADGTLLSRDAGNSPSTVRESLDVGQDRSSTELSRKLNCLKTGCNQYEEQPDDGVVARPGGDVEQFVMPSPNTEPLDYSVVSPIAALYTQSSSANNVVDSRVISSADCRGDAASSVGRDERVNVDSTDCRDVESSSTTTSTSGREQPHQLDVEFDAADPATDPMTRQPDSGSVTHVVINKGNLGLGFCIAGGRGSMTGDNRIVVKRIFKGRPTSHRRYLFTLLI